MTPSLADRCREVLELERNATPGPWTRVKPGQDPNGWLAGQAVASTPGRQVLYADPPGGTFPSADADIIAAARNIIRELAQYYLDSMQSKKEGP